MTSTNYQLGTVYHGEHWSLDADIYKINVNNLILKCDGSTCPKNELYNAGVIHFKGVEGQLNVLVTPGLTLFVNGSINDAIDQSTGYQMKNATRDTAGLGALYSMHGLNVSLTAKYTGVAYAADYSGGDPNGRPYEIHPYWISDFSMNYTFNQHWRIGVSVDNIFDEVTISKIKSDSYSPVTGYGQYDLLYFTPPRQVMGDIRFLF